MAQRRRRPFGQYKAEWDDEDELRNIRDSIPPFEEDDTGRESSKGTFFPIADYSNWRVKVRDQKNLKLDDAAKQRYLECLAKTGKRGMAAAAAGVDSSTIRKHQTEDPEFLEACEAAWDDYREQRVLQIENEAINGFEETIFSPTGEKGTRKRYETALRAMVLKAYDPERYREKVDVNHDIVGGAIVVPLTPTPEEWEAQFAQQQSNYQLPQAITTEGHETFADQLQNGSLGSNRDKAPINEYTDGKNNPSGQA